MSHSLLLLAQDQASKASSSLKETLSTSIEKLDILNRPDELMDTLETLPYILAAVCVVVGFLCVLNGYRWRRWVVIVLGFMLGLGIGNALSDQVGPSHIVAVALGLLCAIVATPMLKISVALFAGLTGALIGANAWSAFEAGPADTHWAGALLGFTVLALTSLLLFRIVIILFTSIGGAAMVVLGMLTLLLQVDAWQPTIRETLEGHRVLIPLLMVLAAVSGFILQQSRLKEPTEAEE